MKRAVLVLLAGAGIAAVGARAAAAPAAATLKGTCTVATTLDSNGVVTSSVLTCQAKGACACAGPTTLVYRSATTSPGNGAPGREKGTLTASGSRGSVTLDFAGTRTALGSSTGSWTLGPVSGFGGVALARRGGYSSVTTNLNPIPGTRSTTVKISARIGCWDCSPAG